MFTPKRFAAFTLTCALGVGLASLFAFAKNSSRGYVPPGDYDLSGRVIEHDPSHIKIGDKITFTYEVRNAGTTSIPAKSYDVEFYVDGKLVSFDRATSGIAPGGRTVYSKAEGSYHVEGIASGLHTFRLVLDPRNKLAEWDESNNVVEGKFEAAE